MCKSIWYWQIYLQSSSPALHGVLASDLCPTPQTTYKDGWNMLIFIGTLGISALTWLKQSIYGTVFFVGTFFLISMRLHLVLFYLILVLFYYLVFSYHCTPLCVSSLEMEIWISVRWIKFLSIKSHPWSWVWGVTPPPSWRPGTPWWRCSRRALSNQTQISKETLTH